MVRHTPEESNNIRPAFVVTRAHQRLPVYDLPGVGLAFLLHDLEFVLGYGGNGALKRLSLLMGAQRYTLSPSALSGFRAYSPSLPVRRQKDFSCPVVPVSNARRLLSGSFRGSRRAVAQDWVSAIRKEMRERHQNTLAAIKPTPTAESAPKAEPAPAPEPKAPTPADDGQIVDIDWGKLVSDEAPDPAFPVDFEYLWPFLGHGAKHKAVALLKARFVEGVEFCSTSRLSKSKGSGGHNKRLYWLAMDCAQNLCLVANTDRAKKIRRYFIAREAQAKRLLEERKELAQPRATLNQDPLAMVERAYGLLERLGGVDERDRLFLRDVTRNALAKSTGTGLLTSGPTTEVSRAWTVGERITHLGIKYTRDLAQRAGRIAAGIYRKQTGREPDTTDRYVDGAVRHVKVYVGAEALALLDESITACAGGLDR